jgi:hypothetical protein
MLNYMYIAVAEIIFGFQMEGKEKRLLRKPLLNQRQVGN